MIYIYMYIRDGIHWGTPPALPKISISEFKLFEGRGHSIAIDNGWKEIAEYSLTWLKKNGL